MPDLLHVSSGLLTLLLYTGAFLLWLRSLLAGGWGAGRSRAPWVAAAAVAVHLFALARYTTLHGELPLVGLAPSLSTLALLLGSGLLATLAVGEASRIGIVLLPLIVLLQGAALLLGLEPATAPLAFRGWWLALHVTLAFAGFVGLAVAGAAGLLWLVQFHEIKERRPGRLFHFLPPLATLDRLVRTGLVGGLVTLSLSIGLGWAWTTRFLGTFRSDDPKVVWALFTWAVFVVALLARSRGARRERRGALVSAVGLSLVILSYVALRIWVVGGGLFL